LEDDEYNSAELFHHPAPDYNSILIGGRTQFELARDKYQEVRGYHRFVNEEFLIKNQYFKPSKYPYSKDYKDLICIKSN